MTRLPITEAQFQKRVTDLCNLLGLKVFHSGDSRRDTGAGFPDLVIVGKPGRGVLFAELKTDKGRLTREQTDWLQALQDSRGDEWSWVKGELLLNAGPGVVAGVWRPSTWDDLRARIELLAKEVKQ